MLRRATTTDLPQLLDFWEQHYAGDPHWVPPLWAWALPGLSRALAEPARFRMFLVEHRGQIVGTASAQREWELGGSAEGVVWLGFFEVTSGEVAAALLDRVARCAAEWGGQELRGPRNLSRFEFVGLAVSGHDRLPPMLQGHHKRAYAGFLEQDGWTPHHDHLAYETPLVDSDGQPRRLPAALSEKADQCSIPGLRFHRARRRWGDRDLIQAHGVLNRAYATVPDIEPMPRAQFLGLCRAVLALGRPELIQLGEVDGEPVAFAVCLPEVNEALVHVRGRLWPRGWARLLRAWPGIQTAAFKLIGVVPELRGTGTHAALIAAVVRGAQDAGFARMDGSVIDERNRPMRGVVEGIGMTVYRRYRVFRRSV
jgi:GNAT superfamily N-acetyltransferase